MKNHLLPRPAFIALLLTAACQPAEEGADITLTFGRIPQGLGTCSSAATSTAEFLGEIDSLSLTVSGPGMKTMSKTSSPGGQLALEKVPVGENRTVLVQGYKNTLVTWTGQTKGVKVTANTTSDVNVLLTRVADFTCGRNGMSAARSFHTATALKDGRVLLVGGVTQDTTASNCIPTGGICRTLTATNTADIFDPATGMFTPTGSPPNNARAFHVAALLPDGKVVIVGGATGGQVNTQAPFPVVPGTTAVRDIEVFDPATERFEIVGQDVETGGRMFAAAVAMTQGASAGQVLVSGGASPTLWTTPLPADVRSNVAAASRHSMLCSSTAGAVTCTAGPDMQMKRAGHTMTELSDGRVLVFGGSVDGATASGTRQLPEFFNGQAFEAPAVDGAGPANNFFFGAASRLSGYPGVFLMGGVLREDDVVGPSPALHLKAPDTQAMENQVWFYSETENYMAIGADQGNWHLGVPRYLLSVAPVSVKNQFNLAIVGGFSGPLSAFTPTDALEIFVGRDAVLRPISVGGTPRGLREKRGALAGVGLASGAALFSGGTTGNGATASVLDTAEIYTDPERL